MHKETEQENRSEEEKGMKKNVNIELSIFRINSAN